MARGGERIAHEPQKRDARGAASKPVQEPVAPVFEGRPTERERLRDSFLDGKREESGAAGRRPPSTRQKLAESFLQARAAGAEREAPVQLREDESAATEQRAARHDGAGVMAAPRGGGSGDPLPDGTRGKMERAFGEDFSGVRVHHGRHVTGLGAIAFTRGADIHFAPGTYRPGTDGGDRLLGHELAHVAQQRAGRVAAPQAKGGPVVEDRGLEREADEQGELAARGGKVSRSRAASPPADGAGGGAVQRKPGDAQPAPGDDVSDFDESDLADVVNDLPPGLQLKEALKDPARAPILRQKIAQRRLEKRRKKAQARAEKKAKQQPQDKPEKVERAWGDSKPTPAGHPAQTISPGYTPIEPVPTDSPVHYDDDTAIEMEVKEDPKAKYGVKDGQATREKTTTTTNTAGDNKDTSQRTVTTAVGKTSSVGYGASHDVTTVDERSTKSGAGGEEQVSYRAEHGRGGSVGQQGAEVHDTRSTKVKVDDTTLTDVSKRGVAANKEDKTVTLSAERTHKKEEEKKDSEAANAGKTETGDESTKKGNVTVGKDLAIGGTSTRAHEVKRGDRSVKQETSTSASLGTKKGLSLNREEKKEVVHGKDAQGNEIKSSRATEVGGNVSLAGAGLDTSHKTVSKKGTQQSVGGGIDVDWKEGSVSGHAGYSLITKGGSGVKLTVSKSGEKVHADDPVKVGEHTWEVSYIVTSSQGIGGGGNVKSVGVNAGAEQSEFHSGVRRFESEKEALEFKEHAAEHIGQMFPPTSAAGALMIPVGETRGVGSSTAVSAGGTVSFEGASVGASVHKSDTHEVDVRRVSQRLVDATITVSGEKGHDFMISAGLADTKGSSHSSMVALTYRFDVTTKEGQEAFELFTRKNIPPVKGGKLVKLEEGKGEEEHDRIKLLGHSNEWTQGTSEKKTTDDKGVHEEFEGHKKHDATPGLLGRYVLGDKEEHSSAQIVSKVEKGKESDRGRETGHAVEVKVAGESGDYNRKMLGEVFSDVDRDKRGSSKASGEWKLSAEISQQTVRELEKNSPRFQNAKTPEERMRILSEIVSQGGGLTARGLVADAGNPTAWDVELKGDPNFPGAAGREQLDQKRNAYRDELARSPGSVDSIERRIQIDIDVLYARRRAVDDRKRYTDLPEGMREEQLKLIDRHIGDFESLRHKALMEMVKNRPGEDIGKIRARMADEHGYDQHVVKSERDEAQLRDRLADKDASIVAIYPLIKEASKAVQDGARNIRQGSAGVTAEHLATYKQYLAVAKGIDARQVALDKPMEAVRLKLAEYLDPKERVSLMGSLLTMQSQKLGLLESQLEVLRQAGGALRAITTEKSMARHQEFWDTAPGAADEPDDPLAPAPMALSDSPDKKKQR